MIKAQIVARTKGSVGADTKTAIYSAAKKLIEAKGFEAMTLRQLAAEVGVQRGLFIAMWRVRTSCFRR
ncbi:TetR family transcriptional regulator [Pseudovibrio denitrificans]|uniref:TetR family transcriptional regulator n=1 Tax=Pseudovibrio denitrificans TaxID=258256 RepID=UPI000A5A5C1E|nr:TetR family transcriptional regulator [Pseudovibrio denitrificans]